MLDTVDKSILRMLQSNSKLTIKEIASKLHLTATPIFERIKRLEKEKYITSYNAMIDRRKVGLSLLVFCTISLKQHEATFISEFEEEIQKFTEVIECYHIGGMSDYLIKVVVPSMDDYQYFVAKKLATINNIGQVQSSFVMREVKPTSSLPII